MRTFAIGDKVTFTYWDKEYTGSIKAFDSKNGMFTVDVGEEKPFALFPRDMTLAEPIAFKAPKATYKATISITTPSGMKIESEGNIEEIEALIKAIGGMDV